MWPEGRNEEEAYDFNKYDYLFRPHCSFGYASQYGGVEEDFVRSGGGRFLMTAGEYQRWGLDLTYKKLDFTETREYLRTGIMLEQVLVKYFHMAIGTVGYVSLDGGFNAFGLCTGLGYEKHWDRLSLALVYKSELLFDTELTNTSSLQLIFGLGM